MHWDYVFASFSITLLIEMFFKHRTINNLRRVLIAKQKMIDAAKEIIEQYENTLVYIHCHDKLADQNIIHECFDNIPKILKKHGVEYASGRRVIVNNKDKTVN